MAGIDGINPNIPREITRESEPAGTSTKSSHLNDFAPTTDTSASIKIVSNEDFQNVFRDSIDTTSGSETSNDSPPLSPHLQNKLQTVTAHPRLEAKEQLRLEKYVHALQQKSGDFYAELALDYLIKNPKQAKRLKSSTKAKIHKLIEKDIQRQDRAKTKLVETLTKQVDRTIGDDAKAARQLGLSTWYDAEIRTQVHQLNRVTNESKAALSSNLLGSITRQAEKTGVFVSAAPVPKGSDVNEPSQLMPQGELDAASGLSEIDLTHPTQMAQTLRAVVNCVKPLPIGDTHNFEARAINESLLELDSQLQKLSNATSDRDAQVHAANALNTLDNILQLDKDILLTPTDRENLALFRVRLREVALRPVVEAFKHQLLHELEYLDEVGSRREIYLTAKLGLGTKDVPALGTLGLSASLKVKLELRNNDYFIKEYKAITNGLGANLGKEGGLFNFAGQLSRTQSHVKQWKSLDDFIDHHSNDILANVVNLSARNVARLFSQKNERDSVSELKNIEKTRASDLQRLNGRLQALGLLDYTKTRIKDGEKVALPRYTAVREFTYAIEGEANLGFGALNAGGLAEKRTSVEEVLVPILRAAEEDPSVLNRSPKAHFDSKQGDTIVNTRALLKSTDQKFDEFRVFIESLEVDETRKTRTDKLGAKDAKDHVNQAIANLNALKEENPKALTEAILFAKTVLENIDPESVGASAVELHALHNTALKKLYQNEAEQLSAETSAIVEQTLEAEIENFKHFETLVLRANTTTDNWVGNLAEQGIHEMLHQRGAELGVHDYLRALAQSTAALTLTAENLPPNPRTDAIKTKLVELGNRIESTNIYLNQEEHRHAAYNEGSRVFHRALTKAEVKIALPLINVGKIGVGVTGEVRWNENSIRDGRYIDIDITLPTLAQLPAAWDGLFSQLSEHGLVEQNMTGILEGDFKELLTGHAGEMAEGASGGEKIDVPILPKFKVEAELSVKLSYQMIDGKPRLLYSHVATERAYEAGIEAEIPIGHAPVVLNGSVAVGKESTVPVSFTYGTGTLQFLIGQYYYWAGADTDQINVSDRQWHETVEHHPNNLVTLMAHASNEQHLVSREINDLVETALSSHLIDEQKAGEYRDMLIELGQLVPEGSKRANIADDVYVRATGLLREFLQLGYRVHTAKNDQLKIDNAYSAKLSNTYY